MALSSSGAPFADVVLEDGRCRRHWPRTHRPVMETRDSAEGFDPPFGSGAVFERVWDGAVPVYALSDSRFREVQVGLLRWRLEVDCEA